MRKSALIACLFLWAGCQSINSNSTISQSRATSLSQQATTQSKRPVEAYDTPTQSGDARESCTHDLNPRPNVLLVTNRPLSLSDHCIDVHDSAGSFDEADAAVEFNAIEKPRSAFGMTAEEYYLLGVVAQEAADYPQALSDYRRARELEPAEGEFLAAEIECLAAMGRWAEARSILDSAGSPEKSGRLAELRQGLSRIGDGVPTADSNTAPAPTENYGLLLVELGRFDEAAEILVPLEQNNHASLYARTALARALLASHQPTRAQYVAERIIRDGHATIQHWQLLSHAIVESADTEAARRMLIKLANDRETQSVSLLLQGFLHMQENEREQAIAALNKSLKAQPNDAAAHCLLASIYEEINNRQLARRHYRLALQIDPYCTQAKKALAKIELKKRRRPNQNPTFS